MKKGWMVLLVIVGLVVLAALWVGGAYNRLVGLEEAVSSAWAQVENVYQRRADLIPNLVATVKGAAQFEQETLQNVIEARAKVGQVSFDKAPTAEQMQAFQAGRLTIKLDIKQRQIQGGTERQRQTVINAFRLENFDVGAYLFQQQRHTLPGTKMVVYQENVQGRLHAC